MYRSAEMEELFGDCVNGVIELLDDQIERVKKAKQRRARVSPDHQPIPHITTNKPHRTCFLLAASVPHHTCESVC